MFTFLRVFLTNIMFFFQYVFVDILHKAIWTTTDYGVTTQMHSLQFIPRFIEMHPTNYMYMFGYDSTDYLERVIGAFYLFTK